MFKFLPSISCFFAAIPLVSASPALAKPTSTPVTFRATAPANTGRHISIKAFGGLLLGSTVVSDKEVFTLVDLNGGALANGDAVQIQYGAQNRPTYWRENAGKVNRTGDKPDKNCVFKVMWKQPQKTLILRAPSGKYVSGPGKGKELVTLAKSSDATLVFALERNPKIVAKPKKR